MIGDAMMRALLEAYRAGYEKGVRDEDAGTEDWAGEWSSEAERARERRMMEAFGSWLVSVQDEVPDPDNRGAGTGLEARREAGPWWRHGVRDQ